MYEFYYKINKDLIMLESLHGGTLFNNYTFKIICDYNSHFI